MDEPSVSLFSETTPSLSELQELVGGNIEVVLLPSGSQLVVNEEGMLLRLEVNWEATILAQRPIRGHAVLLSDEALMD